MKAFKTEDMQDSLVAFVCVLVPMLGQSSVDFISNNVEAHGGEFSLKEGRPLTGQWKRPTFKLNRFLQMLTLCENWCHLLVGESVFFFGHF